LATSCCDGSCVDSSADPAACGDGCVECEEGEVCSSGQCECGPGLTNGGAGCYIPTCGNCQGQVCDPVSLQCVDACPGNKTACGSMSLCVDLTSNPLHCGQCFNKCGPGKLCADGDCVRFAPAVEAGCESSCDGCNGCTGEFGKCCEYPGPGDVVCIPSDANACPVVEPMP
jgi:hypothetical protein